MEIKGYRGSVVTVFYTGLGGGGGRNRLCRKPLPEEVCFNADSVPAEAVMLICPPLVKQWRTSTVEEGKCIMKTYSSGQQREGGEGREREGGYSAEEAHTGSKHGMFFIPPMPTLLHSYPITDPSEGGDILFSVWDCIRPTAPCTTSAHMHTQTHTHISAPHQILQLDEEHQWEQWTSGQTMDTASRPARQPRISWLTPQNVVFLKNDRPFKLHSKEWNSCMYQK